MIALIKISNDDVDIVAGFFDILIYFPSRRPTSIVRRPLRGFDANLHSRLMRSQEVGGGQEK